MINYLIKLHRDHIELLFLDKGDTILFSSTSSPMLYIVAQGTIQLGKFSINNIITQGFLQPNNCFIAKSQSDNLYQGRAIEKSFLLALQLTSLGKITRTHPAFFQFVIYGVYQYWLQMEEFASIFFPKTVKRRTIALILFLSKYFGQYSSHGIEIQIFISQSVIAQIVGSSRVSVTRIFKILQENQSLQINAGRIIIKNPISFILRSQPDKYYHLLNNKQ